jgi:hypothetical protein
MSKNIKPTATATATKPAAKNAPLSVQVVNGRLLIDAPLSTPSLSATGKSFVVDSTHGNIATAAMVDGKALTIGLNAFYAAR